MNVCRFNRDRLGLVDGQDVTDITYATQILDRPSWPPGLGDPLLAELNEVLAAADRGGDHLRLGDVRLDSVVTAPTKIMAAPANYRAHVEQDTLDPGVDQGVHRAALAGLGTPVESLGLFLKATTSLTGPAGGVRIPRPDRRTDYEVELAVVIGTEARSVTAAHAMSFVAGYAVGLDMSIRGTEDRSFRKSADTFTVLGPWLTTADEIDDPSGLTLWLTLNGEERQRASTSAMTVGIPRLIELASSLCTLYPGDVLLTGTPEGVGEVVAGDTLVAGCDGLGAMTVQVSS